MRLRTHGTRLTVLLAKKPRHPPRWLSAIVQNVPLLPVDPTAGTVLQGTGDDVVDNILFSRQRERRYVQGVPQAYLCKQVFRCCKGGGRIEFGFGSTTQNLQTEAEQLKFDDAWNTNVVRLGAKPRHSPSVCHGVHSATQAVVHGVQYSRKTRVLHCLFRKTRPHSAAPRKGPTKIENASQYT